MMRAGDGRWGASLAVAAAVLVLIRSSDAGAGEEPRDEGEGLELSWLAHGQYVIEADDVRKMLEDDGNLMRSGFLLDHFLLTKHLGKGLVLDLGLRLNIPDEPKWVEALVQTDLRKPGRWHVWLEAKRSLTYFDDSIGSVDSTESLYPSHALGHDMVKRRDGFALGVSFTPCTCSRISLKVERLCTVHGHLVPLKGSQSPIAGGFQFEYPSVWDVQQNRAGVTLDAVWSRGALELSLIGVYRFLRVDDVLNTWRPLDGMAFDGADLYQRARLIHSVRAMLGAELQVAAPFTIRGGYGFHYTHVRPLAARDEYADLFLVPWRKEYGRGGGGAFTHTVPVGFLARPADGLDLRLRLVGAYSYGTMERFMVGYLDPGVLASEGRLESGFESMKLTEGFEVSFTRIRWLDLRLRQRLELMNRDLFRVLYDTYEGDGIDTTTAEDVAFKTVRLGLESLVKFRLTRGLVLDARVRYRHAWQDDVVEFLLDWDRYGDSRAWKVDARLRLRWRLGRVVSLWASWILFKGQRWRPGVTEADTQYMHETLGATVTAGARAAPTGWLSLYAAYSYTHGDHVVGPAPLLGEWDSRFYRGRIHAFQAGFGISPCGWFGFDAGYQLALVDGSLENVLHRTSAEARFRVWKELHVGVGYLGRIYQDAIQSGDAYSGHAIRTLFSGTF